MYHLGCLKCSLDHAKKSFYRSANAIFGKVGRLASEEVTLQLIKLIKSKCIPVLLYGLEACPLNKSDLHSLDFVINRFFMKLFRTSNIETVSCCQEYFGFALPAHYGPSVSRNLSFSSVRSVSVGFFYITHYRTLHIALVFLLTCFFKLLPFIMNKDVYKGREATGVVLLEGGGLTRLTHAHQFPFAGLP